MTRSRPPTVSIASGSARLPLPKPIHGELPHWRVHVAGYRGSGAGVCAEVLARAGRLMGYRVAGLHDPTLIGPGLRAWAQLHFASGETRDRPVMIARTPFGEANVLIGVHADETARAVEPAVGLSVASPQRTSAVVNEGGFVGILGTEMPSLGADQFKPALEQVTRPGHVHTADFSDAARHALHTDRLTDAVMIGYAFQLGLIPVTLQAIETAIDEVQRAGFGRLAEAFAVGRRLAHRWPRTEAVLKHRHSVPAEIRRYARMLRSLPWRGRQRAAWYQTLVARTVEAMPGLTESDAGRQSQVDLARAVYRCFLWGGIRCAEQYTTLMLRLYEKDRGDTGRALTRDAILPVADAMLMRDPLYMATMSLSGEEKRRIRQRMNVKLAREDTLEQRFLTRIEAIALRRRVRVELRTSAWLIRLVSFSRHLVPHRWRGTHRKRELRRKMLAFVHAIIAGDGRDYGHCAEAMHKLNQLALSDELHVLPVTVLDSIIGGVQKPDSEDPSSDRDS